MTYIVLTEDDQGSLTALPGQFGDIDDACTEHISFRLHPEVVRFHVAQLVASVGPVARPDL